MLVYDEVSQNITLHKKTIDGERQNRDDGEETVFKVEVQPLRLEMEHFVDCIKTRNRPVSDGRGGLAVVEVLEMAAADMRE